MPAQVVGNVLVDVVEHRAVAEEVPVGERAEALGFLLRLEDVALDLLRELLVLFPGPDAGRDHVLLQQTHRHCNS